MRPLTLVPLDSPLYPARLRALPRPPPSITLDGAPLPAPSPPSLTVAVVGTREPTPEAAQFTFDLAAALARAGALVASGGALGTDASAHRGALSAGGPTLAVLPCGAPHFTPPSHAPLFREIAARGGTLLWPFKDGSTSSRGRFLYRNGVLVALSDVVVALQAPAPSGTLNTAAWARDLGRPVWTLGAPPWDARFTGCRSLVDLGARVLTSIDGFLAAVGLTRGSAPGGTSSAPRKAPEGADPIQESLFQACSDAPRHADEIAMVAGVSTSAAATGLLTLALENVLLEGPAGFYRRGN